MNRTFERRKEQGLCPTCGQTKVDKGKCFQCRKKNADCMRASRILAKLGIK